jgi:hypothetical protein
MRFRVYTEAPDCRPGPYVRNEHITRVPRAVRSVPLREPHLFFDGRRAFRSTFLERSHDGGVHEVDRPSIELTIIRGLINRDNRRL